MRSGERWAWRLVTWPVVVLMLIGRAISWGLDTAAAKTAKAWNDRDA